MKTIFNYCWLSFWLLLVIHGASIISDEWKRKIIHDHGEMVEVKIEELNCPNGTMTFRFVSTLCVKKIDARTCVVFNEGQKIKLKHSQKYPETFLFVNERSPNRFILGGLEIAVGIIGLLANWPLIYRKSAKGQNFQTVS
jgi:hypothetical protein